MSQKYFVYLQNEIEQLKEIGLYKTERVIASPQQANITLSDHSCVLNFCANNYLGLANHPALIEAAQLSLQKYGFGLASVRFICGTQTVHVELEKKLSDFLGRKSVV